MSEKKKVMVFLPDNVKTNLEAISEETGVPQSQLVVLATISLMANYETKGSFIFADLFPEYKIQKGSDNSEKRQLLVPFPDAFKGKLEIISEETNVSQSQLVVLATISLIANYQEKSIFIFADLLNPDHKKQKKK